jgi:DNA repair exonuclease SbcCD ATPase subunit
MSKELTEQWRNGNIQETYYYVKCPWSEGEVDIRYVHNGVDDWKEIVEPVLSYHDLCELKQELEICKDDKADLYAKLCNALMQLESKNNHFVELTKKVEQLGKQLEEANDVILKIKRLNEIMGVPEEITVDYLNKWGVK